jgi:cytoskeletal protein RodZ
MRRLLKFTIFLCMLLFTFSLLGCASNDNSHKETMNEVKTKEVAKQPDHTKVAKAETNKVKTTDQTTETASAETKEKNPEQTAPQTNTNSENTKTNQSNSSASQANPSTSSNKSTAPVTTMPATTAPSTPPPQKPAETVTFSIVGPKVHSSIVDASKVSFNDGETIFDILLQEANKHNIVVDSRGSGATAYVEGIDNYYEFDYGAKSGWVFKLNGVSLTKSIGMIKVKNGDRIECYYTE